MKKLSQNKNLKIVAATSVTLFSLLTVFSATFAWFSMNEQVGNNGQQVKVQKLSGRLDRVEFHEATSVSSETYSFNKTASATITYDWDSRSATGESFEGDMNMYTPLDKNHPLLVLFCLDKEYTSNSNGDIFVRGATDVSGFLGARITTKDDDGDEVTHPLYDLSNHKSDIWRGTKTVDQDGEEKDVDLYALSSVANFKNQVFSASEYTTLLSSETLDFDTEDLNNVDGFTVVNNETEQSTFDSNPYLYSSSTGDNVQYIAIIVNYSTDAIEFIYSTFLGDATIESYEGYLYFVCDWAWEVC